jgi:hypothetical protein
MNVRIVNQGAQLFSVESATGTGSYLCDLKSRTCQCKDFQCRRSERALNDPERACKHQRQATQAAPFLKAAAKAKALSDASLIDFLARYGNDVVIGGALRVERARRAQAAATEAANRAIFA